MKYIVTGVDGQLGGRVAENMLNSVPGNNLIFTCRNHKYLSQEKRQRWEEKGVSVREADYDDKKGMVLAFKGGNRIYIVSSIINGPQRVIQHKNVVDAALEAGIEHLTYTSFLGANRAGYSQYVIPDHTETEKYIAASGIEYNIMRNNLYAENYLINSVFLANISSNKWITPAGDGKATFVAKDDSGRVAAALLLGKGKKNKDYDVTGGDLLSEREICAMVAQVSGINYEYQPVNEKTFFSYLDSLHIPRTTDGDYSKSPVPFCGNDMVTNECSVRDNMMSVRTNTIKQLTGHAPVKIADLVQKYNFVWKNKITNYWDLKKYQ